MGREAGGECGWDGAAWAKQLPGEVKGSEESLLTTISSSGVPRSLRLSPSMNTPAPMNSTTSLLPGTSPSPAMASSTSGVDSARDRDTGADADADAIAALGAGDGGTPCLPALLPRVCVAAGEVGVAGRRPSTDAVVGRRLAPRASVFLSGFLSGTNARDAAGPWCTCCRRDKCGEAGRGEAQEAFRVRGVLAPWRGVSAGEPPPLLPLSIRGLAVAGRERPPRSAATAADPDPCPVMRGELAPEAGAGDAGLPGWPSPVASPVKMPAMRPNVRTSYTWACAATLAMSWAAGCRGRGPYR